MKLKIKKFLIIKINKPNITEKIEDDEELVEN